MITSITLNALKLCSNQFAAHDKGAYQELIADLYPFFVCDEVVLSHHFLTHMLICNLISQSQNQY